MSQNERSRVTFITLCRCSGLLLSPGKNVKHSEMNLLDMVCVRVCACVCVRVCVYSIHTLNMHAHYIVWLQMKMTLGADKSVIISGVWNPSLPFSMVLNEETPKGVLL